MHNEQRSDWWWFMPLPFLTTDYNFHTVKPWGNRRWLTTCYIRLSCKHLNPFPPPQKHILFRNHSELFKQTHLDQKMTRVLSLGAILWSTIPCRFALLVAIQRNPRHGLQRITILTNEWALSFKRSKHKTFKRESHKNEGLSYGSWFHTNALAIKAWVIQSLQFFNNNCPQLSSLPSWLMHII